MRDLGRNGKKQGVGFVGKEFSFLFRVLVWGFGCQPQVLSFGFFGLALLWVFVYSRKVPEQETSK